MKKGFTLIELLVVILIIGILSSVALPQYDKAVEKSRQTEAIVTANSLMKAIQAYVLTYRACPSDASKLDIKAKMDTKFYSYSVSETAPGTTICEVAVTSKKKGFTAFYRYYGARSNEKFGTTEWWCLTEGTCDNFFKNHRLNQ